MELEFVSSLANPAYLQYLGVTMPNIFNPSKSTSTARKSKKDNDNSDAACFARYLKYLHDYWKTPTYSQYLTHPAATIRNLELLQNEQFRRDITRPDLIERLAEGFAGTVVFDPPAAGGESQNGEVAEPGAEGEGAPNVEGAAPGTTSINGNRGTAFIGSPR